MTLHEYLRCLVANRFAGSSMVGLASCVTTAMATDTLQTFSLVGTACTLVIATSTGFGKQTYDSYKTMQKHTGRHQDIEPRFQEKLSDLYCDQAGYRLAAKEAGLEDRLQLKPTRYT